MKSRALKRSNSVIIIQAFSKILHALRKCLKRKMRGDCSNFYLTNHLLNVSQKIKTDNNFIIIRCTTTDERARVVGKLWQCAGIGIRITYFACLHSP